MFSLLILNPSRSLSSSPIPMSSSSNSLNRIETTRSNIERDRIENFSKSKSNDENEINRIRNKSRPYSSNEFIEREHSINEINNSCEFIPESNMIRYSSLFNQIPLYLDKTISINDKMIQQAKYLSFLLSGLAKHVFQIPIETIHLFRDIDSGK